MKDTLRILVTGSRDWTDQEHVHSALLSICASRIAIVPGWRERVTVVHGGARGADQLAGVVARLMRVHVEVHPADWARHGRAAGHRRNAEMVALGADVCLAFPLGESRGTRGCMALAEAAGIPVVDFGPDTWVGRIASGVDQKPSAS